MRPGLVRSGGCRHAAFTGAAVLIKKSAEPFGPPAAMLMDGGLREKWLGVQRAVAAARLDGRWLTLDNRRMAMVEDSDIRNYRPTFVIDQHNVMRYADAPLVADATRRDLETPAVLSALGPGL